MSERLLPDGLTALREVLELRYVMCLIERTARWVDPATFQLLPVWYPEYARRAYFYKANWSEPQQNRNRQTGQTEHKREGNIHANKSLTHALGLRSDDRPNWSCCHIWGLDDPLYQEANAVVQDPKFFSCVANMVLLPTPLKAFTDTMVEVKAMLRICAKYLYGWHCDHESVAASVDLISAWDKWDGYAESWPRPDRVSTPLGVVRPNDGIRATASRRLDRIKADLRDAGPNYPRESVQQTLKYWNISL